MKLSRMNIEISLLRHDGKLQGTYEVGLSATKDVENVLLTPVNLQNLLAFISPPDMNIY